MQINITAPINDTGYGLMCKHLIKHLYTLDDITLFPIGRVSVETSQEADLFSCLKANQKIFDKNATSLRIYHQNDLVHHVGNGRKIGFTVFELDTFSEIEERHIHYNDNVITVSQWGADILKDVSRGIRLPYVVPLGVDLSVFHKQAPSPKNIVRSNPDTFVIMNVGKFEVRKGHDILPSIFDKAFTNRDNVELWMMPHNFFLNQQEWDNWRSLYVNHNMSRKIRILPRVPTQVDLAEIMGQSNCGFFPARAEGWNLELLEMMALGKPVVCLNYSGQSEYINDENSFSIKPKELEPAYDNKWFFGQGNWAKIGKDEEEFFIESLRTLYKTHKEATIVPQAEKGFQTAQEYTWEKSAQKLHNILENING
jgi:glycosyltransferase involved in cell wall biosynthesis